MIFCHFNCSGYKVIYIPSVPRDALVIFADFLDKGTPIKIGYARIYTLNRHRQ